VGLIEILARHPEEVATLRSFRMAAPKAMTPDTRSKLASPVGKRIKRGAQRRSLIGLRPLSRQRRHDLASAVHRHEQPGLIGDDLGEAAFGLPWQSAGSSR
jgi:hypothetical protein